MKQKVKEMNMLNFGSKFLTRLWHEYLSYTKKHQNDFGIVEKLLLSSFKLDIRYNFIWKTTGPSDWMNMTTYSGFVQL